MADALALEELPLARARRSEDFRAHGLRQLHGGLADGIGILGQALSDLAKYIGNAAISYGNTDTNLSTTLPKGAR